MAWDVSAARPHFPALKRSHNGQPVVYLDGPAGSQVPLSVADAIHHHMLHHNANHGGVFATSIESDAIIDGVREKIARWWNAPNAACISFGGNMTTLALALGRALAKTWKPNEEILVSQLDHDANVTPWVLAARDRGVVVRSIAIHTENGTLNRDDMRAKLNSRTRLVAFCAVSNAIGTVNPVAEMIRDVRRLAPNAFIVIDAVHHAPHLPIDVQQWDCDFLLASAYKFFGPHIGIQFGKQIHLETLPAYKLRPAPNSLPDRWMTGTQNFACIAGVGAAIDYLASFSADKNLATVGQQIMEYEQQLSHHFLQRVHEVPGLQLFGITDRQHIHQRVPTFGFRLANKPSRDVASYLANQGIYVWSGNFYALPLTESLQVEPDGLIRAGALHYTTIEELDRLIDALKQLVG